MLGRSGTEAGEQRKCVLMKERRGVVTKGNPRAIKTADAELALKWRLLRAAPGFRPWTSIDEYRHCVLCERTFSGREVRLERDALGLFQVRCATPGCASTPAQWIHPGNPLVSDEAWKDWVKLLDSLCEAEPLRPGETTPAAMTAMVGLAPSRPRTL
jgi:hypothetical protein